MAKSSRSGRHYSGDFDRYNYVNRDIYSSSRRGGLPPRRRRNRHIGRKVLIIFLIVLLLAAIGIGIYVAVMASRVNRDTTDTTSYIQQPSAAPTWEVIDDDKITNILLFGADMMDEGTQRSDTMMLVSIDNKTDTIRLVSFLRDMYVEIPGYGMNKLNSAFSFEGAPLAMQTIENNFRINIDKYILVDTTQFENIIDKMGGVHIEMTQEEADYINSVIDVQCVEGDNYLGGYAAVYFSRMRELDSDFGRTGRQRQMIMAIIDRFKELNIVDMSSLLYEYLPMVTTNMSNSDLLYLASVAPSALNYDIETMQIPNMGTFNEDFWMEDGQQAIEITDLEANCASLRKFLYEEKTSSSLLSSTPTISSLLD